ncbi:MAG: mechanosensitive ion channel family protein, partial [Gammaproteobacteria bacterium]|nr:mechanosensitive ion channel family protein [Gammaproteobacteria bacterium]
MLINSVKFPVAILILLSGLYAIVGNIVFFITGHSMPYIGVVLPYAIFIAVVWAVLRFIKELEHKTITGDFSILPKILDNRIKLDKHSLRMMVFVLRFSVVSIVAFSLLSMLGVSLSGLLAFGGLGGIVLGFALKDILGNFFAGAILFWERPFLVGDWIRCPSINIEGVVDSINWRTTLIKTFDRRPVYVPN